MPISQVLCIIKVQGCVDFGQRPPLVRIIALYAVVGVRGRLFLFVMYVEGMDYRNDSASHSVFCFIVFPRNDTWVVPYKSIHKKQIGHRPPTSCDNRSLFVFLPLCPTKTFLCRGSFPTSPAPYSASHRMAYSGVHCDGTPAEESSEDERGLGREASRSDGSNALNPSERVPSLPKVFPLLYTSGSFAKLAASSSSVGT